ncbi:type II toxin-antitoxin system RelE/ParE family toxin [Vibrio campbellii]|uniref:type II toxin-antitoxin system RelE/ParE family toxin n=1 Tax=Vibrio campbellii TaxID=680 RepID=UPI002109ED42|nr:type II toxin-antitoxin system RelE/ParE family toxin [Vibrio campbellii]UTZ44537.1 type II toxin-antitoxin system RelE/ParE family toxin [Vibrio campbellii]
MSQIAVEINVTKTFEDTVDSTIDYMSQWNSEFVVIDRVEAVVDHFFKKVSENPFIYSKSPELLDLGVAEIREFNRDGFRLFYEAVEDKDKVVVNVLLFLRQKQNVQNQLVEHCLIYK